MFSVSLRLLVRDPESLIASWKALVVLSASHQHNRHDFCRSGNLFYQLSSMVSSTMSLHPWQNTRSWWPWNQNGLTGRSVGHLLCLVMNQLS